MAEQRLAARRHLRLVYPLLLVNPWYVRRTSVDRNGGRGTDDGLTRSSLGKIPRPAMDEAFVSAGAAAAFRLAPLGPQVGSLPHVVDCVSAFLDFSASWSMEKAANREHWRLLARLIEKLKQNEEVSDLYKRHLPVPAMVVAARKGRADVLQQLYAAFRCPLSSDMLTEAARGGHLAVAQWIFEVLSQRDNCAQSRISSYSTVEIATRKGMLDFVELVLEHATDAKRREVVPLVIEAALENGHQHILKWLVGRFPEDVDFQAIDTASSMGLLDAVRLLHDMGAGASTEAMDEAAMHGHLEIVRFLHENRREGCTIKAMDKAAQNGYMDIVRFLHENRAEGCSMKALRSAVRQGHLDIVRYISETGIEGQPCDLSVAVLGWSWQAESARRETTNVLECVDFVGLMELESHALEHCITNLIDIAAANGHLGIVKHLHSCGEACTSTGMSFAAMRGHFAVVEWISENSSVRCDPRAADIAAGRGHLDVVRWLHQGDISTFSTRAMDGAAERGFLDVIRFLHANRSEGCTTAAMDMAARNGHLDVLNWLHSNRLEGCTLEAINDADQGQFSEVVEWLRTHYPAEYEAWVTRGRVNLSRRPRYPSRYNGD